MFTIGADPEVFLRSKKSRALVSAYGLLPGTKSTPHPVPGGAIQVDGMAAEFNIDPVPLEGGDFTAFDGNIQQVLNNLKEHVEGYSLVIEPVAQFGAEFIAEQPDAAKELGCDPDFNAYTLEENPRPDGEKPFRTAAGHIHVGWGADIPPHDPEHVKICASFIKFLDVTVGAYMVLIEDQNERRELYGKAGAFRPKSYGVEYRTPSNVWLKNKARRRAIFSLVKRAVELRRQATDLSKFSTEDDIQACINGSNKGAAFNILRRTCPYYIWDDINATIPKDFQY